MSETSLPSLSEEVVVITCHYCDPINNTFESTRGMKSLETDIHFILEHNYEDFSGSGNFGRAEKIQALIARFETMKKTIQTAFGNQQLDGGQAAAKQHPLYIQSDRAVRTLQQELLSLI